jgi:hypothetical protein
MNRKPRPFHAALVLAATLGVRLVTGCVPEGSRTQAGAVGFVVTPSAGARGEPFRSGNFEVTVEKLDFLGSVDVAKSSFATNNDFEQRVFLINGSREGTFFQPGIPEAKRNFTFSFGWRYFETFESVLPIAMEEPESVRRFASPADIDTTGSDSLRLPTVHVRLRARALDGTREVRLSLALVTFDSTASDSTLARYVRDEQRTAATPNASPDAFPSNRPLQNPVGKLALDVEDSALSLGRLSVSPERIFAPPLTFDELSTADENGDGNLDAAELTRKTKAFGQSEDGENGTSFAVLLTLQISAHLLRVEAL